MLYEKPTGPMHEVIRRALEEIRIHNNPYNAINLITTALRSCDNLIQLPSGRDYVEGTGSNNTIDSVSNKNSASNVNKTQIAGRDDVNKLGVDTQEGIDSLWSFVGKENNKDAKNGINAKYNSSYSTLVNSNNVNINNSSNSKGETALMEGGGFTGIGSAFIGALNLKTNNTSTNYNNKGKNDGNAVGNSSNKSMIVHGFVVPGSSPSTTNIPNSQSRVVNGTVTQNTSPSRSNALRTSDTISANLISTSSTTTAGNTSQYNNNNNNKFSTNVDGSRDYSSSPSRVRMEFNRIELLRLLLIRADAYSATRQNEKALQDALSAIEMSNYQAPEAYFVLGREHRKLYHIVESVNAFNTAEALLQDRLRQCHETNHVDWSYDEARRKRITTINCNEIKDNKNMTNVKGNSTKVMQSHVQNCLQADTSTTTNNNNNNDLFNETDADFWAQRGFEPHEAMTMGWRREDFEAQEEWDALQRKNNNNFSSNNNKKKTNNHNISCSSNCSSSINRQRISLSTSALMSTRKETHVSVSSTPLSAALESHPRHVSTLSSISESCPNLSNNNNNNETNSQSNRQVVRGALISVNDIISTNNNVKETNSAIKNESALVDYTTTLSLVYSDNKKNDNMNGQSYCNVKDSNEERNHTQQFSNEAEGCHNSSLAPLSSTLSTAMSVTNVHGGSTHAENNNNNSSNKTDSNGNGSMLGISEFDEDELSVEDLYKCGMSPLELAMWRRLERESRSLMMMRYTRTIGMSVYEPTLVLLHRSIVGTRGGMIISIENSTEYDMRLIGCTAPDAEYHHSFAFSEFIPKGHCGLAMLRPRTWHGFSGEVCYELNEHLSCFFYFDVPLVKTVKFGVRFCELLSSDVHVAFKEFNGGGVGGIANAPTPQSFASYNVALTKFPSSLSQSQRNNSGVHHHHHCNNNSSSYYSISSASTSAACNNNTTSINNNADVYSSYHHTSSCNTSRMSENESRVIRGNNEGNSTERKLQLVSTPLSQNSFAPFTPIGSNKDGLTFTAFITPTATPPLPTSANARVSPCTSSSAAGSTASFPINNGVSVQLPGTWCSTNSTTNNSNNKNKSSDINGISTLCNNTETNVSLRLAVAQRTIKTPPNTVWLTSHFTTLNDKRVIHAVGNAIDTQLISFSLCQTLPVRLRSVELLPALEYAGNGALKKLSAINRHYRGLVNHLPPNLFYGGGRRSYPDYCLFTDRYHSPWIVRDKEPILWRLSFEGRVYEHDEFAIMDEQNSQHPVLFFATDVQCKVTGSVFYGDKRCPLVQIKDNWMPFNKIFYFATVQGRTFASCTSAGQGVYTLSLHNANGEEILYTARKRVLSKGIVAQHALPLSDQGLLSPSPSSPTTTTTTTNLVNCNSTSPSHRTTTTHRQLASSSESMESITSSSISPCQANYTPEPNKDHNYYGNNNNKTTHPHPLYTSASQIGTTRKGANPCNLSSPSNGDFSLMYLNESSESDTAAMVVAGTSGLPGGFMLAQNNSPAPTFLSTSNTNNHSSHHASNNSVDGNLYHHNARTGNKNTSSNVFHNTNNEHNIVRGTTNNNLYDGSSGNNSNYVYSDNPVNTTSNNINNTAGPLQIKAEYYSIWRQQRVNRSGVNISNNSSIIVNNGVSVNVGNNSKPTQPGFSLTSSPARAIPSSSVNNNNGNINTGNVMEIVAEIKVTSPSFQPTSKGLIIGEITLVTGADALLVSLLAFCIARWE